MKKLLTFTLVLLLAGSTSFFSSCGTKGDPGAQGPQGNANVVADNVTLTSWTVSNGVYSNLLSWDAITPDIVDNGFVEVFTTVEGDNTFSIWTSLPYTDSEGTYSFNYNYDSGHNTGVVEIDYAAPVAPPTTTYFKIIAVAGSVRKMMTQNNVNLKDYAAVHSFLAAHNIKEN